MAIFPTDTTPIPLLKDDDVMPIADSTDSFNLREVTLTELVNDYLLGELGPLIGTGVRHFSFYLSPPKVNCVVEDNIYTFRFPFDLDLGEVIASVDSTDPPTGDNIIVDVKTRTLGTSDPFESIFTTPVTIESGETTSRTAAAQSVLDPTWENMVQDQEITFHVLQTGSVNPGRGLLVQIVGGLPLAP
jgi:hypothetical protein